MPFLNGARKDGTRTLVSEMSFSERYGTYVAITGAASTFGLQFAHEIAVRKLNVLLLGDADEDLGHIARQLEHDHGINASTASKRSAVDAMLRYEVNLLISATDDSRFAQITSAYVLAQENHGLVFVKTVCQYDVLPKEMKTIDHGYIEFHPVYVGGKPGDCSIDATELSGVVKRCLKLLGIQTVYSPKIGESFESSSFKKYEDEKEVANLELLNKIQFSEF